MMLLISRWLGERFAGPTQPCDHPRILAIRCVLEMRVGHAVEVSKHHRLSRGIYGAHAPENWCGGTPSRVTTRIEDLGGIKQFRLSRRDRWCKCRYDKNQSGQ
jgi:hypothetical protein